MPFSITTDVIFDLYLAHCALAVTAVTTPLPDMVRVPVFSSKLPCTSASALSLSTSTPSTEGTMMFCSSASEACTAAAGTTSSAFSGVSPCACAETAAASGTVLSASAVTLMEDCSIPASSSHAMVCLLNIRMKSSPF